MSEYDNKSFETSMTRAYQCEHYLTFKDENNFQIKIRLFTKGNEDSSCERHTTFKIKIFTYEKLNLRFLSITLVNTSTTSEKGYMKQNGFCK